MAPRLTVGLLYCFVSLCAQPARAQDKGPLIMAHRGGAHEMEENTMTAFRTSYEKGIRGFETDVRMTKDGAFVILHDDRIEEYCRALHKIAEARKPKGSIYAFTSFDERPLKAVRALDDKAQTLFIAGKPLSPELIKQAASLKVNYIGCQLSGTSRTMVKDAQKQGFKVNCWPGHTVQDYYLALGLGVDVHCTDIPLAIQKVKEKLP